MQNQSYHELYRAGIHDIGFQPSAEMFPDTMHSWEVYGSLENGMKAHPNIPKESWDKYDFSGEEQPIENPEFID